MSGPAVNIVTGFLGSGKTTLLGHVLRHGLNGRRVALIINEMADLGIDGRVIECANVERMIELNNGCICCTINREFASAIQSIIETTNPHLIIIETTGAAEVTPLVDEVYNCGLRVDACIAVVDALNFFSACEVSPVTVEQASAADFLVLNKIDLASNRELNQVRRALRKLNPRALLVETIRGALESDLLFATSAATFRQSLQHQVHPRSEAIQKKTEEQSRTILERYLTASLQGNGIKYSVKKAGKANHLEESDLAAFSYTSTAPFHRLAFEQFLENVPASVYRAKGIVQFTQERWPSLFNFTCGRFDIDALLYPVTDGFKNQAIFIGHNMAETREYLIPLLEACAVQSAKNP